MIQLRPVGPIGGEIAGGGVGEDFRLRGLGRKVRHQRPVPIELVPGHVHRREKEAIAEVAAPAQDLGGLLQVLPTGPRAVQEQTIVMGPNLRIAGHRLVVQPQQLGVGAEQHVRHVVLVALHGQLVLVPMDASPAVRPPVRIAHHAVPGFAGRNVRMVLVEPTRLRHPQTSQGLVPLADGQQRDLHGQRQFAAEMEIRRRTPENETSRIGQQVAAGRPGTPAAIPPADCRTGGK